MQAAHYTREFTVRTTSRFQLVDVTGLVEEAVRESGVSHGLVHVFVPHATAALILNEAEERLMQDILEALMRVAPPDAPWRHNEIDDNAHAHIAASIVGPSRTAPVAGGRLVLGTWQRFMLVELDGPRTRRLVVTVLGVGGQ